MEETPDRPPGESRAPFAAFEAELPFPLAAYQRQALDALAEPDLSVIVVAPTGSGKSVIADAAIWQALTAGATAAYTSPLRALANQRFGQLATRWGDRVGLLTGDTVVRPRAPGRVMTAELFRTVTLLPDLLGADAELPVPPAGAGAAPHQVAGRATADSDPFHPFLRALAWAIFDEAHYLADPQRGTVWEEAILATPPQARILCLSATIGEPRRLLGWLRWLGRSVRLIEVTERPVPLRHYLYLRQSLHLVMDERWTRAGSFPFAGGWALAQRRRATHIGGPPGKRRARGAGPVVGLPTVPPDDWIREEAVAALRLLREHGLTPVIAFVPSRREAERLAEDARGAFVEAAGGVAVHHAGVPALRRRAIEEQLRAGALWLVSGTTTLAAGLDVPARSVLLTSYGRFDGREFVLLSPAEYRQLAGRAGRLGRDELGAVVLLPSPWHGFEEAFRALTAPLPPIESAFRPAYATALAWWGGGGAGQPREARQARLATALAGTFSAYLRRSRGGRDDRALPPPSHPDGPSLIQARALGGLLERDGLVAPGGALAPRGAFVLHVSGGAEGRLLLRLLEEGAFEDLDEGQREVLLATTAAGAPTAEQDPGVTGLYLEAHRAQVALERAAGALLTPAPPPRPAAADAWRRRYDAADLLERSLRAARRVSLPLSLLRWGPALLDHWQEARHDPHSR